VFWLSEWTAHDPARKHSCRAAKAFERAEERDDNSEYITATFNYRYAYKKLRLAYELATDQVAEEE
jgi:hypothetical protein